jgi:hypothetical protein
MPIVVILFFVFIIGIIIYSKIQADKRRAALAAYAAQRGLNFSSEDPFDIPGRLEDFSLMQSGSSRCASNVFWGTVGGSEIMLFEYQYVTGSGKHRTTHHYVCCQWRLPVPLASLAVRPENVLDHVAEWFGHNDIDFESSEFSRRYHVKGDDKREVYAVFHPRMMEFLMQSDLEYLEVIGDRALTYSDDSSLTPECCEWFLALARGFNENLPEHVIREKGGLTDARRSS